MDYLYPAFGLLLRSNQPISGLIETDSLGCFDVQVYFAASPAYPGPTSSNETLVFASPILLESGEPCWRLWRSAAGDLFRLDYSDGVQFWVNSEANSLWATWSEASSFEDAATYLLGPVLGFLLRLRGVICLHASAVALNNQAVAFVGDAGAGKSTTAAALAQRGYPVISDDIVALDERDGAFFVPPAYPYLCLWPPSVRILYGAEKALPALSPNYDKRQLALSENSLGFEARPLPLAAIYLLGERSPQDRAPFLSMPSPRERLMSLIPNSYANLAETELRAREFEVLGRLVRSVPVRRLHAHEDGTRIDSLCELIERDLKSDGEAISPPPPRSAVSTLAAAHSS